MNKYFIHDKYTERLDNEQFDDTGYTDEHQDEVYSYAKGIWLTRKFDGFVCDVGCGSGYKLLKYFKDVKTIGIDVGKTVEFLQDKYPSRLWYDQTYPSVDYNVIDMVICADAIEHVQDPDQLLKNIQYLKPKIIVISTPDRDMLFNHNGPPQNLAHVREWSYHELQKYISQFFEIEEHFISSITQCTQCIICSPRS